MSDKQQNPNRRFLGKVLQQTGQFGVFLKILIDNPSPTKWDSVAKAQVGDQYNKGVLLWCDNETGKKYLVKQLGVHGVGKAAAEKGFTNSISLDLDDEYQVQGLD